MMALQAALQPHCGPSASDRTATHAGLGMRSSVELKVWATIEVGFESYRGGVWPEWIAVDLTVFVRYDNVLRLLGHRQDE